MGNRNGGGYYYTNDRYKELEEKYLETKDERYLNEMYQFLYQYYKIKVKKYASNKRLHFTFDKVEQLVSDMASRSIMHYIYHPRKEGDFKMNKLSAYASFDFKKIILDEKDIEINQNETSWDGIIESFGGNEPLLDWKIEDPLEKIDLLVDAQRELPGIDYNILKALLDCPTSTVDSLADDFETSRKEIVEHLEIIRSWYANTQTV